MKPLNFYQKLIAVLLFLVAIFFGFFHLSESPAMNADEGYFVQSATNLAVYGSEGLQTAPGHIDPLSTTNSVGYPFIWSLALWFKIFGPGILTARILMVLFSLGFIVLSFVLTRRLFGNNISLAVLALVATFPPLYGNGKAVMGEMPGMFLLVLTLFLFDFMRTNPARKNILLILTGVSAGLFIVTKVSFILFVPALIVGAFVEWKRRSLSLKDLGIAVVGVIVPIIILFVVKFQPGDSLSTILGFYANPSHVSDLSATVIHNIKALFTQVGPLYTIVMLGTWLISFCLRWRERTKITFEETASFVFAVLNVLSFTRTAGSFRYLLPAQLIALLFFPNALQIIFNAISNKIALFKKPALYIACISILGIFGIYQLMFDSYVAESYSSHKLAELQAYFDAIPATTTMFFYNSEGLVPFFHGRDYYQHLVFFNQEDWTAGADPAQILGAGKVDMLVSGLQTAKDVKAGVFDKYVTVRTFDKTTIMRRR